MQNSVIWHRFGLTALESANNSRDTFPIHYYT